MKIAGSSVAMESAHREFSYQHKESVTMKAAASKDLPSAILTLSAEAEGKSYTESMEEYQKRQKEEAAKKREENETKAWQDMAERLNENKTQPVKLSDEYEMKLKMLRQLLEALRGGNKSAAWYQKRTDANGILDLRSEALRQSKPLQSDMSYSASAGISASVSAGASVSVFVGVSSSVSVGTTSSGTMWQRVTATSGFMSESESTTFASQGIACTEDGRSISFQVEVSMSRSFMSRFDTLEVQNYVMTDPLMINLDTNVVSVSDQKFLFDLDSDGKKEEISFAGSGSGFLALDKNGDGVINDGSELFGTSSGDGFKDLAAYDEDGNGWIDENDGIFKRLKVWTKDEDGKDRLMDLKAADVGAIYLGAARTEFQLKDDENRTNGAVRKTGIYLKESTGQAGTLNHVDLAL